jgi:hypothetical protein
MKSMPDKPTRERVRRPSPALVMSLVALFASTAGSALALQANSIRSKHIVNGQVKTGDLADGSVGATKLAPGSVNATKIADSVVGADQLADRAIGGLAIANGSLIGLDLAGGFGAAQLGSGSVTAAKLTANSITGAKVQTGGLSGSDLASGALTGSHLTANSVNSARVLDNSLTGDDIVESDLGSPLARGLTRVDEETASNSTDVKEIDATCPAGKVLIGGGADVSAGSGSPAALVNSFPLLNTTTWRALASEPDPNGNSWSLGVYAICAST